MKHWYILIQMRILKRKIAKTLGREENHGVTRQFVIQYDVEIDKNEGEVNQLRFFIENRKYEN